MKKFLVLGVGNAQIDLIKYLRVLGSVEIHACSYKAHGKGPNLVDFFEIINIADKQAVLDYVLKRDIDFVYSVGSDIAMPTACWVAEQARLPNYVSYQTAELCNNKHQLRQALGDHVLNLKFTFADSPDELKWHSFPAMIKPVDSQGQRGVYKVHSLDELLEAFPKAISHSRSGKVIVEEYADGPEYSINMFISGGKIVFAQYSDREVWPELPGGIIHKHHLPCSVVDLEKQSMVISDLETLLPSIGLNDGPAYLQMKATNSGAKLIEVTPRLDGCHMWKAIFYFTGVDLLHSVVDGLMNTKQLETGLVANNMKDSLTLEFICQPPDTKVSYAESRPHWLFHEHYYNENETTPRMNGFMEKIGYIIY
jgi:hypothetical protein